MPAARPGSPSATRATTCAGSGARARRTAPTSYSRRPAASGSTWLRCSTTCGRPGDRLGIRRGQLPLDRVEHRLAVGVAALVVAHLPELRRREAVEAALHLSGGQVVRSEEHTSELQSPDHLVCRLLLEKKKTASN